MPDTYLIEIRLARTRWRMKQATLTLARSLGIGEHREEHPHVTLYGPLVLRPGVREEELTAAVDDIAARYGPVSFTIDNWEKRDGMHGGVLAFTVRPSEDLRSLTTEIAASVSSLSESLNVWDAFPDKKWFHVTIANHIQPARAEKCHMQLVRWEDEILHPPPPKSEGPATRIRHLLRRVLGGERGPVLRPPLLDDDGLRVTVMHGEEILSEYDLARGCPVTGAAIHDRRSWQDTLTAFRERAGFSVMAPQPSRPGAVFVMSDLHLGHANIIRYCSRPFLFPDVAGMDCDLIRNWNNTVTPGDRVFYLGDLRYGRDARPAPESRMELHGDIVFVKGNHDSDDIPAKPFASAEYRGIRFLFVHDPADAPEGFEGWVVHGHHHNNDLRNYPFISFKHRRVNVSAEVVGYRPIALAEIHHLITTRPRASPPILVRYPYVP
jgi:calcineurin-like phosphoesterase family protein